MVDETWSLICCKKNVFFPQVIDVNPSNMLARCCTHKHRAKKKKEKGMNKTNHTIVRILSEKLASHKHRDVSGAIWGNIVSQFIWLLRNIFVPLCKIFIPYKNYKCHCKIYLCLIEYIFSPLHHICMSNKINSCHYQICLRSNQIFHILIVLKTCISENMVRAILGIPFKIYTAITIYLGLKKI